MTNAPIYGLLIDVAGKTVVVTDFNSGILIMNG